MAATQIAVMAEQNLGGPMPLYEEPTSTEQFLSS